MFANCLECVRWMSGRCFRGVRIDQVRIGQVKTGQVKIGQVRTGQVRTGQVMTGPGTSIRSVPTLKGEGINTHTQDRAIKDR